MNPWSSAPAELRRAVETERPELLDLLGSITADEWLTPTPAAGWCVRDVAVHLLDDDLGWLSRDRDGDMSSLIPMIADYRAFVRALDQKNQRWVEAANGLSQRVVRDLLAWSGAQVAAYHESSDGTDTAGVAWAGGEAPAWLGIGRDFTERWVHHKQIREAVRRPGDHDRYLPIVLSVFVWAFPHQYRTQAPAGTTIDLDFGAGARWHLERRNLGWELQDGLASAPAAAVVTDMDTAWRQLTGALGADGSVTTSGPPDLAGPLLDVRGIIV